MLAPTKGKFGLTAASKVLNEVSKKFKTVQVKSKSFFERQPDWKTYTKCTDMKGQDRQCFKFIRSSIVALSGGKILSMTSVWRNF